MNKLIGKINDDYIHHNINEIVDLMGELLPEKKSNSRNWRFNLKKENVSNNISYVSYAMLHKLKKWYDNYEKRVDSLYEKESAILENERRNSEHYKKRDNSEKLLRDVNQFLVDKLKDYYDEREFWDCMKEEFTDKQLNYIGIYCRCE
tara:strand:+ start:2991 stop:3434 length:444 start_codon:yes stop_codon:yes gene_type:complete